MRTKLAGLALVALAVAHAGPAAAVADPAGDFLPTFAGPHNLDLDVLSAEGLLQGGVLTLTATMAGNIGQTTGGFYVWGANRGAGTARFTAGSPSIGAGVLFDSVIILNQNLTGTVARLTPSASNVALAPGSITIDGPTIRVMLPISLLPTQGFAPEQYTYNIWPRSPGAGNTFIADFAPDASNFTASVPEPATWALVLAGFGLAGAALRRRRLRAA